MRLLAICFLGILVPCFASSNDLVSLKLKATGCEHTCTEYADNTTCPSSIIVNGYDKSQKKDGFNILVIDNYSGQMVTASFRWYSSLVDSKPHIIAEHKRFKTFFGRIKSSSVIIILFQNMCDYFQREWYSFLTEHDDMKVISLDRSSYYIAIVVACKFSCPKVVDGSIPYSYSGPRSQKEHTVSITMKLRTASKHLNGNGENDKGDDEGISYIMILAPLGAVALGVIILLTCCYCNDTYKRTVQQNGHLRAIHYGRTADEITESRNGTSSCPRLSDGNTEPLYEELGQISKPDERHGNMYVDRNDIKQYKLDDDNPSSHLYDEPTITPQPPTAPPLYLYAPLSDNIT